MNRRRVMAFERRRSQARGIPAVPAALTREVDGYLASAPEAAGDGASRPSSRRMPASCFPDRSAAHAYKAAASGELRRRRARRAVALRCVRRGRAVARRRVRVSARSAATSIARARARFSASPIVTALPRRTGASIRSRCSCRFSSACFPGLPIVPVLIGHQRRATIEALATALAAAFAGPAGITRREHRPVPLFRRDDRSVTRRSSAGARSPISIPKGCCRLFEGYPEYERGRYVACGGGAAIAVMMAARDARRHRRARAEGTVTQGKCRETTTESSVTLRRGSGGSASSNQLSAISISYQLSVISYQLSAH